MTAFTLKKTISWDGTITDKVKDICKMFGLTIDRLREQQKTHSCKLDIKPGDVIYITGPSGSDKSVLLRELENAIQKTELISHKSSFLPTRQS